MKNRKDTRSCRLGVRYGSRCLSEIFILLVFYLTPLTAVLFDLFLFYNRSKEQNAPLQF
jgi:hypothetical protein